MLSLTIPSQLTTSTKGSGFDIISTLTSLLFEHLDLKQGAEQVALWTATFSVPHGVNMLLTCSGCLWPGRKVRHAAYSWEAAETQVFLKDKRQADLLLSSHHTTLLLACQLFAFPYKSWEKCLYNIKRMVWFCVSHHLSIHSEHLLCFHSEHLHTCCLQVWS